MNRRKAAQSVKRGSKAKNRTEKRAVESPARDAKTDSGCPDVILNGVQLALFFGVSRQSARDWITQGCPRIGRRQYSASAVAQWRMAKHGASTGGDADPSAGAKARHNEAKAELAELELARERAKVVPIESVKAMRTAFCDAAKAESRNMVDAIATKQAADGKEMQLLMDARDAFLRRMAAAMDAAQGHAG